MIPSQVYIALLAIGVYLWPWRFELMGGDADDLFTCITVQLFFICACTFVKGKWALAVIMIEATSIAFNIAVYLSPASLYDIHGYFVLCALALELLVITFSQKESIGGGKDRYRLRMASYSVRTLRNSAQCHTCFCEVDK